MGVSPFPPTEIIFQFPSTEKYSHRIIRSGAGRDLGRKPSPCPLPVHQSFQAWTLYSLSRCSVFAMIHFIREVPLLKVLFRIISPILIEYSEYFCFSSLSLISRCLNTVIMSSLVFSSDNFVPLPSAFSLWATLTGALL